MHRLHLPVAPRTSTGTQFGLRTMYSDMSSFWRASTVSTDTKGCFSQPFVASTDLLPVYTHLTFRVEDCGSEINCQESLVALLLTILATDMQRMRYTVLACGFYAAGYGYMKSDRDA